MDPTDISSVRKKTKTVRKTHEQRQRDAQRKEAEETTRAGEEFVHEFWPILLQQIEDAATHGKFETTLYWSVDIHHTDAKKTFKAIQSAWWSLWSQIRALGYEASVSFPEDSWNEEGMYDYNAVLHVSWEDKF